jgi:Purple acid Phosphatase, N-terminal domain
MTISWSTNVTTSGSSVVYGESMDKLKTVNVSAADSEVIYLDTSLGGLVHHHVTLDASVLNLGTNYLYSVCAYDGTSCSSYRNFTTSPAVGNEFPMTIAAFGDMSIGIYGANNSMIDLLRVLPTLTFMHHWGDIGSLIFVSLFFPPIFYLL